MLGYIVYGLVWMFSFLPLSILYLFSDVISFILYYIVRYRRNVVRTNLQNAYPQKNTAEIIAIEKTFYRFISDVFVEMYAMWHFSEKKMRKHCSFKNVELLENYFAQGKSIIGVTGHYCNWEWMTSFALWNRMGVDFFALYKPIHNKAVNQMTYHIRTRFGANLVPKNDVVRHIVSDRRENKLFFAAFVGDQTPKKHNLNFWMDFLRQDTPILLGTETLAKKFKTAVITIRTTRPKRGYYVIEFEHLCDDASLLPDGKITTLHTQRLEQLIDEYPQYWLWSHRRWKHKRQDIHD